MKEKKQYLYPSKCLHRLLLYQKFSHHLCITTGSFFFLYPHRIQIRGDLTGAVLPVLVQTQRLCVVFGTVLSSCVGIPILSACLCLPQTCVRVNAEAWRQRIINAKSPLILSATSFSSECIVA